MTRFTQLSVLLIALLFIGCPRPTKLTIQNRSGGDALILTGKQQWEWKREEVIEVPMGSEMLEWKEDGAFSRPWLHVQARNQKLEFLLNYVLPPEWTEAFSHRLELRADLSLYAVRPNGSSDDQPAGFPLRTRG